MAYAQNNYSLYGAKKDANRQPIVVPNPHLYNPAAQGALSQQGRPPTHWNSQVNQQPQHYWQQPQVSYNQPVNYIPAVQQSHTHNSVIQDNQWNTPQNAVQEPDPWNWGVDDNSSSADASERVSVASSSSAWDWGVQPPLNENNAFVPQANMQVPHYPKAGGNMYAQQPLEQQNVTPDVRYQNSFVANNNTVPPAGVDFSNSSGHFYAQHQSTEQTSTTQLVNRQNSPIYNNIAFSNQVPGSEIGTNFYMQPLAQPMNAPMNAPMNTPMSDQEIRTITNNYAAGLFDTTNNFNAQQPVGGSGPENGSLHYPRAPVNAIDQSINSSELRPDQTTISNYSVQNQLKQQDSVEEVTDNSLQSDQVANDQVEENSGLESVSLTENDVSEELRDNISDASSVNSHQVRYMDYMALQNNEFEYLNPTGSTTGNKGLAAQWSTESLHSQGSDDVSPAADDGLTSERNAGYDLNQYENYNNYPDSPTIVKDDDQNSLLFNLRNSTSEINSVSQQMESLAIASANNAEAKTEIFDNIATRPEERAFQSRSKSNELSPPPAKLLHSVDTPATAVQLSHIDLPNMQIPSPTLNLPPTGPFREASLSASMHPHMSPAREASPSASMQHPPMGPAREASPRAMHPPPVGPPREASPGVMHLPPMGPPREASPATPMVLPPMALPKTSTPPQGIFQPNMEPLKSSGAPAGNPYAGKKLPSHIKKRMNYTGESASSDKVNYQMKEPVDLAVVNHPTEDAVNLETVPDNEELPSTVEEPQQKVPAVNDQKVTSGLSRANLQPVVQMTVQEPRQWVQDPSPENQEVAPHRGPDRNQYLETGQLSDDEPQQFRSSDGNDWSGLQRMVPGQNVAEPGNRLDMPLDHNMEQNFNEDATVSTPPPGLYRMVPGQFTEQDNRMLQFANRSQFNDNRSQDSSDDVLLQRMVPGRTEDQHVGFAPGVITTNNVPPPGLRRMVPGESSSPESQGISVIQAGTRVVTGDGQEEDQTHLPSVIQTASKTPSLASAPSTSVTAQPTAERSETIGSDSVETYAPQVTDNSKRDSSSRRENSKQDRERLRDEDSGNERESHRRKDYHNRDREESPEPGTRRYKADSRKGDRDRRADKDRRKDRRGRDRGESDSEEYESDRYLRDRRDRYPRDKSSDSRRYRDSERNPAPYDSRDCYRDPREDSKSYSGRSRRGGDHRSGSEYNSDYDRRDGDRRGGEYDRKGYSRRDYDQRHKHRYRDDYEYNQRYDGRHRASDRSDHERSRYETAYREKVDPRPESRGHTQRAYYPPEQQAYYGGALKPQSMEYYAYYNQLRLTDPAAYADWYNTVYTPQLYQQSQAYSEDRGSVHSGRSSAENNNALYRERDTTIQEGEPPASSTPQRLTPTFFSTSHVRAVLNNRGQMIKVLPHYPMDGQPAIVEIHDVQALCANYAVREDLAGFPGPLIKGITHKNSIISYCNRKIQGIEQDATLVDRESAILLWDLLILLIRQNGTVIGPDIAELLLSGRQATSKIQPRSSVSSTNSQYDSLATLDDQANLDPGQPAKFNVKLTEEEATNAFREFLLYGNTKDALEYAMKNGLWGHALFLASKLDARTHANVMMRFANGLTLNDPLQTLYQLKSGRQPAAVTCCVDEKWGCWRPHLAMILSNGSIPEIDHKAVTTLGDTLAARGCLHAAHFCYLMAQIEFMPYSQRNTAKLILIGSSHHKSFKGFATNEAIQMTEIFEYASRLNDPTYSVHSLQWFKHIYAQRLVEQGQALEALAYTEEISKTIIRNPDLYDPIFIGQVFELGDQLKYIDPLYTNNDGSQQSELPWLTKLEQIINNCHLGAYTQAYSSQEPPLDQTYAEGDYYNPNQQLHEQDQSVRTYIVNNDHQQEVNQSNNATIDGASQYQNINATADGASQYQNNDQSTDIGAPQYQTYEEQPQADNNYADQAQQWQQQQQWQPQRTEEKSHEYEPSQPPYESIPQNNYQNQWEESTSQEELSKPQISLPNSYADRKDQEKPAEEKKPQSPTKAKSHTAARGKPSNRWFDDIWSKLSLKPKNQMILPEDKNPTIVWDPDRKRWVNMDADGEEAPSELAPPPKAADLPKFSAPSFNPAPVKPSENTNGDLNMKPPAPVMANGSAVNKYKLNNKGRSFRSNYVDVFGSSKMAPQEAPPPDLFPLMSGGSQSIFTPGSNGMEDTTVNNSTYETNKPSLSQHMSRWSSTSSLSREVESYTTRGYQQASYKAPPQVFAPNVSDNRSAHTGPVMFDPRSYGQPNADPLQNKYPSH